MKWIGQHIWSFISRFRNDVYLDDPTAGGSDPDKFLGIDANNKVIYRTGTEVLSDIGVAALISAEDLDVAADSGTAAVDLDSQSLTVTGGTNATTSATGQAVTINVDDAFIKNNAADTMAVSDFGANAALFINADQPATAGAENSKGLHIDYDRIVAGSGTAAHNDIGIDLDVNSATLGTGTVTGMDIDIVGATSGTHTAIGIDLDVGSADTNLGMQINTAGTHMKLVDNTDTADYCTIGVTTSGATTITTVDGGAAAANFEIAADGNITLDAAGDIALEAAGNDITVDSDTVTVTSSTADQPIVKLLNTTNDDQASQLVLEKLRADDGVANGQNLGEIWFRGQDNGQNTQNYAYVIGEIDVSTGGQESGSLTLGIANHDGGMGRGLQLTGGSVDAEIDVTVGLGTASVTTIAGDLVVTGTGNTHFVGQYAVLRCQAFYVGDNPFVQNNLYFGNSVGHQPWNWGDPAAVGGPIGDTSSFTIPGDDENWGIVLPFNISRIEVQCSLRPNLGAGTDFTIAIYTGIRSDDADTALTLTKIAHNSVNISETVNRYTQNDVAVDADLNKDTMIYVGVGTEDDTDMKNGRGYMNITVVRR